MIVRESGGTLWLFDQLEHSVLCGELARRWGAPPFRPVPESVQRAAEMHDSGWPEWDARPRLDARTGRPHPYSKMPDADYHEIWRRGLARGWVLGEESGLLVSLHAMRFFGHKTRPEDRGLYQEQRARQAEALRSLGAPHDDVEALPEPYATWHAWMFFWDGLSLFLCEGWRSPWTSSQPTGAAEQSGVRVERIGEDDAPGGSIRVSPFPFFERLSLEVGARVIPGRSYASQHELDAAVAGAERRVAAWEVLPGGPDMDRKCMPGQKPIQNGIYGR
jgi:hypothetical protein